LRLALLNDQRSTCFVSCRNTCAPLGQFAPSVRGAPTTTFDLFSWSFFMLTNLFSVVGLSFGLFLGGLGLVAEKPAAKDCCAGKAACCAKDAACCATPIKEGCCAQNKDCCAQNKDCCTGAQNCCEAGAECCAKAKACCGTTAKSVKKSCCDGGCCGGACCGK
jgi:hypothetical protein